MAKTAKRRGPGRPRLRNAYTVQLNLKLNRPIIRALASYAERGAATGARLLLVQKLLDDGKIKTTDLPE